MIGLGRGYDMPSDAQILRRLNSKKYQKELRRAVARDFAPGGIVDQMKEDYRQHGKLVFHPDNSKHGD